MISTNESRMKVLILGYDKVLRLSQYIGDFQPEAHVKGFAGSNLIDLICSRKSATLVSYFFIRQMYKVFYQDRIIYLTNDFSSHFYNDYGLFYKFYDLNELSDLLKLFLYLTKIRKLFIFHSSIESLLKEFTKQFKVINAGGGAVFNEEGKILIIKRQGIWDLPKGKFQKGELPQAAAIRETEEEVGLSGIHIDSSLSPTFHIYEENGRYILKKTWWFKMKTTTSMTPVPQTEEDITDAVWMSSMDIQHILGNTYLSVVDVIGELGLLSFSK